MCLRKRNNFYFLILIAVFCVFLGSCDVMDTILPTAGGYRTNIQVNNTTLDECSYITSKDIIRPFFENAVSNDQDVTGLMVFLKNSSGDIVGQKVLYRLEPDENEADDNETNTDELVIFVETLDDYLPSFPLSDDLAPALYTMVSQVMSGNNILQRIERSFYYLSSVNFLYNSINAYLPGITESSQLIPKGTLVLLEAGLNFNRNIDPYIVWYEGKNIISEGFYSEGYGKIFWKAPEQSGFFYLRAEVFPVKTGDRLSGYNKNISLLVSSIAIDVHLVSENIQQLLHWYTFEGNLNDSKMTVSAERMLKPEGRNAPLWMGLNGTYGIVTGRNNTVNLPRVNFTDDNSRKNWQTLFRFSPINDGEIFSVSFGSARNSNARLRLIKEGRDLVLSLTSSQGTSSQIYSLPEESGGHYQNSSFLVAGISFSVLPESISAHINILGSLTDSELTEDPAVINAAVNDGFQVLLGYQSNNSAANEAAGARAESSVIWDEFALYYMPPSNFFAVKPSEPAGEET